ncbi:NADH dehydrogenase subunit C /NADH dehydrogenase subunit D [Fibrobacter sp. UWCM]|jgi:NADH-quinone oxidoreductase subunit D/NADH-quinone oxidoreductase subunit C/D|uniref:NADH-quinone oxidoreductase subunit D n=1 Tax=unclassified Fibrobacter TaxID=2634177 RepID=UPI0009109C3E|nr:MULTISPECIES: NADH-quinone oxidoreductase subunit D [unclassified Fibrobacter]MBR2058859.1 NADH-quinone oxidoreductase subunit D [Fibrobacter sp.]MBR2308845.1 NADH-quinone oxidoreductase subunit D [Fibrobacter sp.]MBR4008836.1 NADH-quinone oxidoreductase subunit D [Fibrobacter sp.]SHH49078.1 NADH dehydrogenase subunit C /NADH dehydrogenase subunit D [Fibrobacter sp. UWCM]SHN00847.1 NADH dehydrogenase subunit C /NADH dehydrogenase subunit D [Fibrobacter sp. UWR3]
MIVLDKNGDKLNLMPLNVGPSHPATHGCLRFLAAMDGETIVASVEEIGYLHRGFEKMVERGTWQQVVPYTDRLNYCSAIMNNIAYCRAVENMFGVEIPERTKVLRVIVNELSRINDHFVCVAAAFQDLGGTTPFMYAFNPREEIMCIWEKLTGARLTNSFARIGGLYRDSYEGFEQDVLAALDSTEKALKDLHACLDRNRIFLDRTVGIGKISAERAISYGWTGPCLRACGVASDLRKDEPYYDYETYDWEVVVGTQGDCNDRLQVRLAEIEESVKIVRQALKRLAPGPVDIVDPRIRVPAHKLAYQDMEGLIGRFKSVYEGIRVPEGEYYCGSECANGELGFTIVSDGSGHPYRIKVRPPCLTQFAAFHELVEGGQLADSMAVLSGLNIIAGELDR